MENKESIFIENKRNKKKIILPLVMCVGVIIVLALTSYRIVIGSTNFSKEWFSLLLFLVIVWFSYKDLRAAIKEYNSDQGGFTWTNGEINRGPLIITDGESLKKLDNAREVNKPQS